MTFTVNPLEWHWARIAGRWADNNFAEMASFLSVFNGAGIHVGVYDSGTQASHHDLNANYDASRHVTYNGYVQNYTSPSFYHGTAVAGLIGAESNGTGGTGVAFGAGITGVFIERVTDGSGEQMATSEILGDLLEQAAGLFDVINCSWGSFPGSYTSRTAATMTPGVDAFRYIADYGRDGLGTVIVKAAGNSPFGDAHYDTRNALKEVIVVSGLAQDGEATYYSSRGANVLVSAPAGEDTFGSPAMYTTDLLGASGVNSGDFTNGTTHAIGTSFAAPLVTGLVALMLDVNPNLGWRDVQTILSLSSDLPTGVLTDFSSGDPFNAATDWNGGGRHFDSRYGFGEINIPNAVRMAEAWKLFGPSQTSANEYVQSTATQTLNQATIDVGYIDIPITFSTAMETEYVSVTINFTHTRVSEVRFVLTSPQGTVVEATFLDAMGGRTMTFVLGAQAFRGENPYGQWNLRVYDDVTELPPPDGGPLPGDTGWIDDDTRTSEDTGTITSVSMEISGVLDTVNDIYHYTDEFFTMALAPGENTQRTNLIDTDGGTDWLNFSAMEWNLNIDLTAGASSTANTYFMFQMGATTQIEHVVAGDGADTLVGNGVSNDLHGMRGADVLYGMGGNDRLYGGDGADFLSGGDGDDFLYGGAKADQLYGGAGADLFYYRTTGDGAGDTIYDFVSGVDVIEVPGWLTYTLSYSGGLTYVQYGSSDIITVHGTVLHSDIQMGPLVSPDLEGGDEEAVVAKGGEPIICPEVSIDPSPSQAEQKVSGPLVLPEVYAEEVTKESGPLVLPDAFDPLEALAAGEGKTFQDDAVICPFDPAIAELALEAMGGLASKPLHRQQNQPGDFDWTG